MAVTSRPPIAGATICGAFDATVFNPIALITWCRGTSLGTSACLDGARNAFAAAIPAASTDPAAARAFVAALTSPALAARWTAAGFEPPGK